MQITETTLDIAQRVGHKDIEALIKSKQPSICSIM